MTRKKRPAPKTPPKLAKRIRSMREQSGWSRNQLARLVGVSPDSIHKWETGEREPRGANLVALADAFECEAKELVSDSWERQLPDGPALKVRDLLDALRGLADEDKLSVFEKRFAEIERQRKEHVRAVLELERAHDAEAELLTAYLDALKRSRD